MSTTQLHCPSAEFSSRAKILGVVLPHGGIALLPRLVPLDAELHRGLLEGRDPELRFRFSAPCLCEGCQQWTEGQCGVAARAQKSLLPRHLKSSLSDCPLRPKCRWFAEQGETVCKICPDIQKRTETAADVVAT